MEDIQDTNLRKEEWEMEFKLGDVIIGRIVVDISACCFDTQLNKSGCWVQKSNGCLKTWI